MRHYRPLDLWLGAVDQSLRTVFAKHHASRPMPAETDSNALQGDVLTEEERALSGALMRVNHVGEVCAQALYTAQAWATRDPELRTHFELAAQEEEDHLAWTEERLKALGDRVSWLNPLWYAGAFAIGAAAGRISNDKVSLGFVVETERQVEQHLQSHLEKLPLADRASRCVVEQMKNDEAKHAEEAQALGAVSLPAPVQFLMRGAAKVMTSVAHHL